ncbi:Glyoxalase/Bleomycin resistance protein/Dihydroxybiphenyl dioxygenase [Cenococcum geophilum]
MPLHHFFIYTVPEKFEETAAWYLKALAPLNYVEIMRVPGKVAMGADSVPEFWVGTKEDVGKEGTHFAFKAKDQEAVQAFHAAGVAAGGKCNGAPGPRPQYSSTYYAAFVLDPVGNNVESVCFTTADK